MSYTTLQNAPKRNEHLPYSLEGAALSFIRERCEGLRFDEGMAGKEDADKGIFLGKSLKQNEIPYNMEMDIDRLCLENAVRRFLKSGKKEDAFDVYFCYLYMFVGDYDKTRRMIELLSEFEVNGSELLMKHRDHYVHSVYVFVLGLALYETKSVYRTTYKKIYGFTEEHEAASHYLKYWGMAALFHDIGYPFELPFEQVASYFEINGEKRSKSPFISYQGMKMLTGLKKAIEVDGRMFETTDALFAYLLAKSLGEVYGFTEEGMRNVLEQRALQPELSNYYMDHAYFSATVLFGKLFDELECELEDAHLDAITAILLHNSLYKFKVAHIRSEKNIPLKMELHPLAYMLMLCDELQCWDRVAYGRNSKMELHPMGCRFDLSGDNLKATYLFDDKETEKVKRFEYAYQNWKKEKSGKEPELKAYSKMYVRNENGITTFQADIERIIDMTEIEFQVDTALAPKVREGKKNYLSNSNFMNLYNFAIILNGRWGSSEWAKAEELGQEEQFLKDEKLIREFVESFRKLSLEYKLSNINQAKAFAGYMDAIHCFYTDKEVDFEFLDEFTEEEVLIIGPLEHKRWLQEHYDMGWEYGEPERKNRELLRTHRDMIPGFPKGIYDVSEEMAEKNYNRLDKAEQDKDIAPMECMLAMLKVFDGLRIYRL